VAVADVPRRREGLEAIVAGLAADGMPVASWRAVAAEPQIVSRFDHLVALDPPPGGRSDPLLGGGPRAHLAWGPAEAAFALLVWRAELEVRPALVETYRTLRDLPDAPSPEAVEAVLRGPGRYPRAPETCATLLLVLADLALVDFDVGSRSFRVLDAPRTELARSATYRACQSRLAAIERALAGELDRPAAGARAA
jgi:hypothetical protein